ENTYRIVLMFKPELFSHGLDPLPVVRNLRTCGEVIQFHLITDRLPALAAVSPETCYLGCEMVLRSSLSEKELRSELEFVQDDCEISISEESAVTSPAGSDQAAKAAPAVASASASAAAEPASPSFGSDPSSSKPSPTAAQPSESRFVRVESGRLDHLVNLVGELVIQTAHLNQIAELSGNTDMAENSEMVYKIVSELRDHAFGLRMIPIGGIFSRFQRIVHDLKADLGKDVQLELRGQETELDKSLVERLFDPLLHLVRNSIDHGIEKPEERSAGGKPASALLRLSARHEASEIIIEVQDDGRGLDTQKILARAKERGLVRADEILDTAEIQRLIFQPGFSTADAVTNLSGRGVGMDVVKREIQAMRGRIDIQSERGAGTLIRIRLPLTLAIIDGLCVRLGESFFIIPLDIVIECLEYDGSGEGGVMNLRGEVLPLLHTARLFNIPVQADDKQNIVVVQHAGRKAGVVVQEIRGEVQSVIRPIGKMLGEVEGIGGSTILGDGAIALILDIPALAEGIVKQDRVGRHMVDLRTVGA
ncbi:MAG TPA: chemotaxis protein CheA, partial [Leptospiraceae bacterium]|nr:chemotaxis protein CheA [Leptospiraceae bacterium]